MEKLKNEKELRQHLMNEAIKHQYPIAVYLNEVGEAPTDIVVIRTPMELVDFAMICWRSGAVASILNINI